MSAFNTFFLGLGGFGHSFLDIDWVHTPTEHKLPNMEYPNSDGKIESKLTPDGCLDIVRALYGLELK